MPEYTGTFFDVDPDWKEFVNVNGCETGASGGNHNNDSNQGGSAPSLDYSSYWETALTLVNAWSSYQAKKRLEINASYKETEFKVAKVVEKHFGGEKSRVHDRVQELSRDVDSALSSFAIECRKYKLEPITRDQLYQRLTKSREYSSLRGKIKRRMARNKPPGPLWSL